MSKPQKGPNIFLGPAPTPPLTVVSTSGYVVVSGDGNVRRQHEPPLMPMTDRSPGTGSDKPEK